MTITAMISIVMIMIMKRYNVYRIRITGIIVMQICSGAGKYLHSCIG